MYADNNNICITLAFLHTSFRTHARAHAQELLSTFVRPLSLSVSTRTPLSLSVSSLCLSLSLSVSSLCLSLSLHSDSTLSVCLLPRQTLSDQSRLRQVKSTSNPPGPTVMLNVHVRFIAAAVAWNASFCGTSAMHVIVSEKVAKVAQRPQRDLLVLRSTNTRLGHRRARV